MATVEKAQSKAEASPRRIEGEQRFLLHDIPWKAYVAISDALGDRPSPRVTYDRGSLEFMTPLGIHEFYKCNLSGLIQILAEEAELEIKLGGEMTFRRQDLAHGFELDNCLWIDHEAAVRGKTAYDAYNDPPPDLGIEIEITRSAIDRMGLFAAIGIAQIWRFDGDNLWVEVLQADSTYRRADRSPTFPWAPLDEIVPFIEPNPTMGYLAVIAAFRQWAREKRSQQGGN
jgi:hypothetical protein